MSEVSEAFAEVFGRPEPAAANGVHFTRRGPARSWESLQAELGAGWFMDGFLYLFGEGLAELSACLEAWAFLVPPSGDRMVFGRNAYGALLVLEGGNGGNERVYVLDPFTVTYHGDPQMHLRNTISNWLPGGRLPGFLDDSAYRAWRTKNNVDRLDVDDVLGIKVPEGLGGTLTADNLQLDTMLDYYQSTGAIYAKAFADKKQP